MKINLLCLAGAGLGLLSLFLPWWSGHEVGLGVLLPEDYSLVQDVMLRPELYGSAFLVACTLFLAGTGIAFLSPIGGLVQLPGVLGFMALFGQEVGTRRGTESFELGAYIALVASVLTTISLLVLLGPGYGVRGRRFWTSLSSANRFLSIGRYDDGARARINLLALAGAVTAFVCIALPWTVVTTVPPTSEITVAEHSLLSFLDGDRSSAGAYIFIIGAAASVVTTMGGFVQLAGLLWFWWDIKDTLGINSWRYPGGLTDEVFGLGYYISVIAITMVVASLFLPLGMGYRDRRKPLLSRMFAWGRAGTLTY